MVRHKSRWLLVKIEQEDSVKQLQRETYKGPIHNVDGPEEKLSQSEPFQFIHTKIEKKNIYHSLSAVIQDAFGINGMGIVDDIQVKLFNNDTRMAIIQVPRDDAKTIQAAITLMMSIGDVPIVASVISTHGSARTMKIAALLELKRSFDRQCEQYEKTSASSLLSSSLPPRTKMNDKQVLKRLRRLEDQMEQIRSIE